MNIKYNSRKFIVALMAIIINASISVYAYFRLTNNTSLANIISTCIMWNATVAMTYIGGNTAINWKTNGKGESKKMEGSIDSDTSH